MQMAIGELDYIVPMLSMIVHTTELSLILLLFKLSMIYT